MRNFGMPFTVFNFSEIAKKNATRFGMAFFSILGSGKWLNWEGSKPFKMYRITQKTFQKFLLLLQEN